METRKAWNANLEVIKETTINGITITLKRRIHENEFGVSGGSSPRAWFATIEEAQQNWDHRISHISA